MINNINIADTAVNIHVYPNPVHEFLTFNILGYKESLKAELYNLIGIKIKECDIDDEKVTIGLNDVLSGVYLLKIFDIRGETQKVLYLTKK